MNNSRRLLDSFRAAVVKKQNNQEGLAELFDQYSERFAQLYEARGERLLDSELALQEQAPKTGVKKTEVETGSTANL
jgi:hypothetical protein